MTLNQNLLENLRHSKPAVCLSTLRKNHGPGLPTITQQGEDNESTIAIFPQLEQETPITPPKSSHPQRFSLRETETNHLNRQPAELLETQPDKRPFSFARLSNFERKGTSTTPNNLQELPFHSHRGIHDRK